MADLTDSAGDVVDSEFLDEAAAKADRRARRKRFLSQLVEGDSYGTLLVVLVALFITIPAIDGSVAGRFVLMVLTITVLMLALHISRVGRTTMIVGMAVSAILIAVRVAHDLVGHDVASGLALVASGVVLGLAPLAVGRRIMEHRVVARETILGAICVYVMLGLLFCYVFQAVQFWSATPFFGPDKTDSGGDFFYFSYVTLTTLGYGDLAPVTQWGRSFAILEALVGQLYLATTIARLVGAVGMRRIGAVRIAQQGETERSGDPEDPGPAAEPTAT